MQTNSKRCVIADREAKAVERAFRRLAKAPNKHEFIRNCNEITRKHFWGYGISFDALSELIPKSYVIKNKKRLSEFDLTGWNYPDIVNVAKTAIVIEVDNPSSLDFKYFVFTNEKGEWSFDFICSFFLTLENLAGDFDKALKKGLNVR